MADGLEVDHATSGRVFCDTSYFYACGDTDDAFHRQALALSGETALLRVR